MMKLKSEYRFIDTKLKSAYLRLKDGDEQEKELFRQVEHALKDIEENAFCGVQIPRRLIPKDYMQKHKIPNLWKYDLPKGWRLLYSIVQDELIVVSLILEWSNHKK